MPFDSTQRARCIKLTSKASLTNGRGVMVEAPNQLSDQATDEDASHKSMYVSTLGRTDAVTSNITQDIVKV